MSARMPPADSAAHPGIAHAVITARVVSIPSATANHSPGSGWPSRTAPPPIGPSDRFCRFLGMSAFPLPSSRRYPDNAVIDVLDERDHGGQFLA
jgi:hypothetical protein